MPTAAQDLSVTLRLEAKFRPELRKYNNQVVRAFRAEYIKSGNVINLALFDDQLEQLLANHYDRVSGVFNDRISPELPLDVATTEGEREVITAALLIWIASRAKEQAEIINGTTQEEAGLSIEQALDDEIVRTSPDRITAAAVAASIHLRLPVSRLSPCISSRAALIRFARPAAARNRAFTSASKPPFPVCGASPG